MDARDTIKNVKVDTGSLLLNPRFIGPCIAGLFCLTVATVIGILYLFTMATVLLALPFAGYIIGAIMLKNCTIRRDQLVTATQGDVASTALHIECNLGNLPSELTVKDKLPVLIEAENNAGLEIFGKRSAEIRISFRAVKRGRYSIGPAVLFAVDPLGTFRLKRRIPGVTELIVHPKPVPFRISRLIGGNRVFDHPNRFARPAHRGDFAGVRDYRFGDELKRVHWKTTARTQRLSVMEFEDSTLGPVTIMLDLSEGSDYGTGPLTSLDTAAGAAAFALSECLRHRRPVRLSMPSGTSVQNIDVHSPGGLTAALTALSCAEESSCTSAIDLIRSCTGSTDAILITTQVTEDVSEAAREASRRGIKLLIALIDPEPFGRQPASSAGLERSGASVEIIREAART